MNPKTTIGLVLALVAAVAGVWWAQSTSKPEEARADAGPRPLFDIGLFDITGFEVKSGNASTCSFVKTDGQWRMSAPIEGPCQEGTVSGDVTRIANLKSVKAYEKGNPDAPSEQMTSLNDPPKVIKLTDKDGKSYILKIGARQQLSKRTYVQKDGDDTIYLVDSDLNKDLRRKLSDYRGKQVARFTSSDAVRVEVQGDRNYTLAKTDGQWMIESPIKARADLGAVNKILTAISTLNVSSFVDDNPTKLHPYGLEPPRLIVAVTTEKKTPKPIEPPLATQPAEPQFEIETSTIRIAFGGTAEDKVFAKLADADSRAVFQLAGDVVDRAAPPIQDLRDRKIAAIQRGLVQKIKVTSGEDSVLLVKEGSNWKIAAGIDNAGSEIAEFAAVDDLLKAVRDLKAIGFESSRSPAHGFTPPRCEIEIYSEGQIEPLKLLVGGLAPSKTSVYVKNDREGFIAAVAVDAVEPLTVKPIAFLSREILQFARARASRLSVTRNGLSAEVHRVGASWQFVSPVQGKAESTAVNNMLSDLSNLRGRRVVARSAEAARFGLDDAAVRVTVSVDPLPMPTATTQPAEDSPEPAAAEEAPVEYTVLVSRHENKVYAMRADGATVCEVDAKVIEDLEAELLDTRVLALQPSQAHRLTYTGNAGFAFEKIGDGWGLPEESSFPVDATKITQTLETLRDLRASRFVSYSGGDLARYGLDVPEIRIIVNADDGRTVALSVSARGPDGGGRYASVDAAPDRVFIIESEDLEKLRKQVADFRKAT